MGFRQSRVELLRVVVRNRTVLPCACVSRRIVSVILVILGLRREKSLRVFFSCVQLRAPNVARSIGSQFDEFH